MHMSGSYEKPSDAAVLTDSCHRNDPERKVTDSSESCSVDSVHIECRRVPKNSCQIVLTARTRTFARLSCHSRGLEPWPRQVACGQACAMLAVKAG